jgi:hypothetical protein
VLIIRQRLPQRLQFSGFTRIQKLLLKQLHAILLRLQLLLLGKQRLPLRKLLG